MLYECRATYILGGNVGNMTSKVTIFTDGSCSYARGQSTGFGGWACILMWMGQKLELSGGAKETTNNRMELMALIEALKALIQGCEISLYTDSAYVITTLVNLSTVWKTGKFKTRTGDTPANADLIKELLKLKKIHTIHPHWVKGHAKSDKGGNVYNHRCDELAYAAMCKIANENGVKKDIRNRKEFK